MFSESSIAKSLELRVDNKVFEIILSAQCAKDCGS